MFALNVSIDTIASGARRRSARTAGNRRVISTEETIGV
jgi:hypothetical protein